MQNRSIEDVLREFKLELNEEDGRLFPHILDYFRQLAGCRNYTMGGPLPLNHQEILAWCTLTRISLSSLELALLRDVDRIWLESLRSHDSGNARNTSQRKWT